MPTDPSPSPSLSTGERRTEMTMTQIAPERVPNAAYTPDAEIIQEAAALLAQCGPDLDYVDCADTALEGICALWGRDEDDKCTGMKAVAVPPEHEDGSAPEWKLLQYAARLTRIAQSQAAQLAAQAEALAKARGEVRELDLAVTAFYVCTSDRSQSNGFKALLKRIACIKRTLWPALGAQS